jgi:putative Ca2+/H+ antiporter (TMEM165/GDT1 family)
MRDAAVAFGLTFVAELGDKSMLLAIALAARFRPRQVLAGIATAAVVMLGLAALIGGALGSALPERLLAFGGGALFIAFGLWSLRSDDDDDASTELRGRSVWLGVTIAFLVAEFGDKTMLAVATLASTRAPVPTWLGASVGMTLASGLAVGLTMLAGRRVPERTVRLAASAAFLLFGALLIVEGLRG